MVIERLAEKFTYTDNVILERSRSDDSRILPTFDSGQARMTNGWVLDRAEGSRDDLRDAGLDVEKEMDGFLKRLRQYSLGVALSQVEMNIRSHLKEYPDQGLVLPNPKWIKDGKLIDSSGLPVIPMIKGDERDGAVLEASCKAEKHLVNCEDGMAVITSPTGWTGLRNSEGRLYDYMASQTVIFKRERGTIQSVTLVTDMTRQQNKQFLIEMGVDPRKLEGQSEKEEIANIVRNPALLSPNLGESFSIEDIANKILAIRGRGDIKTHKIDGSTEIRPVSALLRDIRRVDQLLIFSERAEKYLAEFRQFVLLNAGNLENGFMVRKMAEEMKRTILKITGVIMDEKNLSIPYPQAEAGGEFDREVAYLKSLPGCANGRTSDWSILSGNIVAMQTLAENPWLEPKECISCGEIILCGSKCHTCGGKAA